MINCVLSLGMFFQEASKKKVLYTHTGYIYAATTDKYHKREAIYLSMPITEADFVLFKKYVQECSWDWLWIHCDQDRALTASSLTNKWFLKKVCTFIPHTSRLDYYTMKITVFAVKFLYTSGQLKL